MFSKNKFYTVMPFRLSCLETASKVNCLLLLVHRTNEKCNYYFYRYAYSRLIHVIAFTWKRTRQRLKLRVYQDPILENSCNMTITIIVKCSKQFYFLVPKVISFSFLSSVITVQYTSLSLMASYPSSWVYCIAISSDLECI